MVGVSNIWMFLISSHKLPAWPTCLTRSHWGRHNPSIRIIDLLRRLSHLKLINWRRDTRPDKVTRSQGDAVNVLQTTREAMFSMTPGRRFKVITSHTPNMKKMVEMPSLWFFAGSWMSGISFWIMSTLVFFKVLSVLFGVPIFHVFWSVLSFFLYLCQCIPVFSPCV